MFAQFMLTWRSCVVKRWLVRKRTTHPSLIFFLFLQRLSLRTMTFLVGSDSPTQISFIEYQALIAALAGIMCLGLGVLEIILNRFQVLPVLFSGMFSVRDRRFYIYDVDISDGPRGKMVRMQAKMLTRVTFCVVLSYVWQHCVLETLQKVGSEFPQEQCDDKFDCFASDLHFLVVFTREYLIVDCDKEENFSGRVVISCIRFVTQSATNWLMHTAIAYSVTQLNFKFFELFVWIAAKSTITRHLVFALLVLTVGCFFAFLFAGALSVVVTSWLSFVLSFAVPMFFLVVWRCGETLSQLWKEDEDKIQRSIEEHLNAAFKDVEEVVNEEAQEWVASSRCEEFVVRFDGRKPTTESASWSLRSKVKNFLTVVPVPNFIGKRLSDTSEEQRLAKGSRDADDGASVHSGRSFNSSPSASQLRDPEWCDVSLRTVVRSASRVSPRRSRSLVRGVEDDLPLSEDQVSWRVPSWERPPRAVPRRGRDSRRESGGSSRWAAVPEATARGRGLNKVASPVPSPNHSLLSALKDPQPRLASVRGVSAPPSLKCL